MSCQKEIVMECDGLEFLLPKGYLKNSFATQLGP